MVVIDLITKQLSALIGPLTEIVSQVGSNIDNITAISGNVDPALQSALGAISSDSQDAVMAAQTA